MGAMTLEQLARNEKSFAEENADLRARIAQLENEVRFLREHFTLAQGMKGETLVARLTAGVLAENYAQEFDLRIGDKVTVEVKFSKLNIPSPGSTTRRWNWNKPLGWKDKGQEYDFLILVGERDPRFADQYPNDGSPYVFFLLPKSHVSRIMTKGETIGANVQIITNLMNAKSPASIALKEHIVPVSVISALLATKEEAR
jgi:hypothetical protein